jgi:hypothetical protein
MAAQMENCNLREETQDLWQQVAGLQKTLEDLELESAATEPSAPQNQNTIDALRSALRKHATLYDPFSPKDKEFYQQLRPYDSTILTDYNKHYEDEESESQANLAEFYVTLPQNHILRLSDGDLDLVRQVRVYLSYHFLCQPPIYRLLMKPERSAAGCWVGHEMSLITYSIYHEHTSVQTAMVNIQLI